MNDTIRIAVIAVIAIAATKALGGKVPALDPLTKHL